MHCLCKVNTVYSYVLFRMMELLLFLCLLISALLLCWMLVAALILCLLLGTVMALQMYQASFQQNDANRYHTHRNCSSLSKLNYSMVIDSWIFDRCNDLSLPLPLHCHQWVWLGRVYQPVSVVPASELEKMVLTILSKCSLRALYSMVVLP